MPEVGLDVKPPTAIALSRARLGRAGVPYFKESRRLGSALERCVCVCEGREEGCGGWGSCDPTAPRPTSQAGETQTHVWVPPLRLTRHELVEGSPRLKYRFYFITG